MSIIADTLQRLQTQTTGDQSDAPDTPSLVIPARGKREPGWHTPPSRSKILFAGIGITLGLSALGMVAYWIGFHLDFGMSTYATPRTSQDFSLSDPSPIPEPPSFNLHSDESMQMPVVNSVQDDRTSAPLNSEEEQSTIQDAVSPETPYHKHIDHPLSAPPMVKGPISTETTAPSILPKPPQPQLKALPTKETIPNKAIEKSATKSASFHPLPAILKSDTSDSIFIETEASHEPEKAISINVDVEEEHLSSQDLSTISHQSMGDPSVLTDTTAMIPKQEKATKPAHLPDAVQLPPSNVLRHTQQLIQAGKYREARMFLSPLFKDPPVMWEPWFWMGTAYLGEGDLEQADQFFLSGLARNDKIPQLWVQRALVAQQQGNFQLAVYELRQAASLQPDLPHIHLNMGYAYERMGNDRLANQYFRKFLQLTEGNPEFFSTRKKLLARLTTTTGAGTPPQEIR